MTNLDERTAPTTYDPFARGPFPVGVVTEEWTDTSRGRTLVVETWFPAPDAFAGSDLDPGRQDPLPPVWSSAEGSAGWSHQRAVRDAPIRDGRFPLLVFSHGFAGHRYEATFLTTHLASHGYAVVSADHAGSTAPDIDAALAETDPDPEAEDIRLVMMRDRRGDVPFLVSEALRRRTTDADAIGVVGISLGGWTALTAPTVDPRVRAIAPLCPAGGTSLLSAGGPDVLAEGLEIAWDHPVAVLHGVADRDAWVPLHGQLGILKRIPRPARMVVLRNADHNHFVDDVPGSHRWYIELTEGLALALPDGPGDFATIAKTIPPYDELCDERIAYDAWCGLVTVHMDAALRGDERARDLLANDLERMLDARGIDALVIER